jgi:hypothetical protein
MEYLELDEKNPILNRMNFLNGRVDAISNNNNLNIEKANIKASEHQGNIISRNLDSTDVSKIFFSVDNINILQRGIRNKILNMTNGKINISRQSDDELKIIMRSIYFQYGKNNNTNIRGQILELNTRVIEWSVPEIISNYKQSQHYLKDISTLPEPLDRSILPSKKGTKTLNVTNMY